MGPAVYARISAMALWQVGLERLHHGAVAAACGGGGAAGAAAVAGCDGRPCGAVTPTTTRKKNQLRKKTEGRHANSRVRNPGGGVMRRRRKISDPAGVVA